MHKLCLDFPLFSFADGQQITCSQKYVCFLDLSDIVRIDNKTLMASNKIPK